MKRTGLTLTLLLLVVGLLADPLFCCALPSIEHLASLSAPAMDCCPQGDMPGCAPKVEKAAGLAPVPVASATSVFMAATAAPATLQVSPPRSMLPRLGLPIERPPRFHPRSSPLRI
jgi:hypothetical protein